MTTNEIARRYDALLGLMVRSVGEDLEMARYASILRAEGEKYV